MLRFLAAICIVVLAAPLAMGQAAAPPPSHPVATPAPPPHNNDLQADAERLLKLAQELKASVDKTRRDELSMQVIRQADEIDRLARSAKARIH